MKITELRKYARMVGRKGLSIDAINAVNDFDGSYKGAMELCGKLSVIAKCATFDEYWDEQVHIGVRRQENMIESLMEEKARGENEL